MTKRANEPMRMLVQCPGCHTHVKATEEQSCPFCETSLSLAPGRGHAMEGARRSLSRRSSLLVASLFGLSTLGGVAMQACDTKAPTEQTAEKTGSDGGAEKAPTETPTEAANDGGTQDNKVNDAPVLPPYGIPPDQP